MRMPLGDLRLRGHRRDPFNFGWEHEHKRMLRFEPEGLAPPQIWTAKKNTMERRNKNGV